MQKDTEPGNREAATPGYEVRDVDVRGILRPGLVLIAVTVFTFVAMTWILDFLEWRADWLWKRGGVVERQPEPPPEPRLQVSPPAELAGMQAENERILGTYGWVDRPNQVVRIPVERAMELVLQEGLPTAGGER